MSTACCSRTVIWLNPFNRGPTTGNFPPVLSSPGHRPAVTPFHLSADSATAPEPFESLRNRDIDKLVGNDDHFSNRFALDVLAHGLPGHGQLFEIL